MAWRGLRVRPAAREVAIGLAALGSWIVFCGYVLLDCLDWGEKLSLGIEPKCLFKWLTDFPCPTCGITRSLSSLAQGEFVQAMSYHPFGWAIFLLFTFSVFVVARQLWRGQTPALGRGAGVTWLVLLLISWLCKLLLPSKYW
jgi:hypothetical protein